jgi:hypothetical protein
MSKHSTFQKAVKAAWGENAINYPVVCKRDGSVEIKSAYFYRHGQTSQKWAHEVEQRLDSADFFYISEHRDDWREWPKTSYFVAVLRPTY